MSYYGLTIQQLQILNIIATEEKYGYQILKDLNKKILLGSLYNSLKSLEKKGFISSFLKTDGEKERKFYKISSDGERVLESIKQELQPMFALI